ALRFAPIAPLGAVNAAEVALLVGPFIPDAHAVVVQIFDIGITAKEPQKLINDRLEMKFFRSEQWESFRQGKTGLRAENAICAGSSAIGFKFSLIENKAQQI